MYLEVSFFCYSNISGKMSSRANRTVYVGNLPGDIREREVEDLFHKVCLKLLQ